MITTLGLGTSELVSGLIFICLCKPKWDGDLIITWEPVVCTQSRHWVTRGDGDTIYLVYCHVNPVFLHVTEHGSNKLRSLEFLCKIENKETS